MNIVCLAVTFYDISSVSGFLIVTAIKMHNSVFFDLAPCRFQVVPIFREARCSAYGWDTIRKVACSIPNGVFGIFQWHNPSGCPMALGSTHPLTEMSTRNTSWGKGGRCVGPTILSPSCADCLEILKLHLPGNLRACPSLQWDCSTFYRYFEINACQYSTLKTDVAAIRNWTALRPGTHCTCWHTYEGYWMDWNIGITNGDSATAFIKGRVLDSWNGIHITRV